MAGGGSPCESFRDEASCSICLGFFQDPVSIHCGHNFCRGCITRRWEDTQENFPCPLCRETAPQGKLRPNRELAKLLEIAKRLSLRAGGGGEKVCWKHREALKLFCEEERTPICLVCRESQAHRAHLVVPIEEAAEEEKEKFQTHVGLLKDKREKLLGLKATEEGKNLDLLERVAKEKKKVSSETEELQRFLVGQERLLLERLEKLEEEIRRRQEEKVNKLLEEISCLGEEIQELEEKCQQPALEFLLASRNIWSRLEKEVPREEGEEGRDLLPHGVDLQEAMRKYRVSLTLDPETAHPRLLLSPGGKGVRWGGSRQPLPDTPKRFDSSRCVLGLGGFLTGRGYWEVEVGGGGEAWALGVAKESVGRKGRLRLNPQGGVWGVGRCGGRYQALTSPPTPLSPPQPPQKVGVYLDYEGGRVAFFDARRRSPLFSYPPTSFGGEQILPLLCLGRGGHFTLSP